MMNAPTPPKPGLMPLEDALAQILAAVQPLATEPVNTFDADRRVLAQDIVSAVNVPPLDNSAMDGYAVRVADLPEAGGVLQVTQRIPAGSIGKPLEALSAARIFTGAPVPEGADAVVMQEDCQIVNECEGGVRVNMAPRLGQNIRRAGEDIAVGQTVLTAGTVLGPAHLGLAASVGMASLSVRAKPRVALISTGDELVMPGEVAPEDMARVRPGAIYNSNRFFLRALLQRLGCEVNDLGIIPDDCDATKVALQRAAEANDLIVSTGGVSVGEEDHVKPAIEALGALSLWALNIKPGKPFAFGHVRRSAGQGACHFMGLPGNPVASWVTFLVLVRPFLLALQGRSDAGLPLQEAVAAFDWPRADKRREFLRVRHGANGLERFANQSSGVLASVVWAEGLVDNPPGQTIAKGDTVRWMRWKDLLA
jgi:molybdopterin molybdotransferase